MCEIDEECDEAQPMAGGAGGLICWIPKRVAVLGKVVGLRELDNGRLIARWRVEDVVGALAQAKILRRGSSDRDRQGDSSQH